MKLENCQVSEVNVFCPKPDENVYLVWWKPDPAEEASGSLFQCNVMLDYDTEDFYVSTSGKVTKFEAAAYDYDAAKSGLESLTKSMSTSLNVSDDVSGKIAFFIQALLSDEADDLEKSDVDYRWLDYPNGFHSMNNDLGKPEKRIHIRVKSNTFGDPVSCGVSDDGLEFSKEGLGLAFAISRFEQSD